MIVYLAQAIRMAAYGLLLVTVACSNVEMPKSVVTPAQSLSSAPATSYDLAKTPLHAPRHHVFAQPDPAMPLLDQLDFAVGRSFFRNPWVQAPATTAARDGLGPLYSANSCGS